MFFGIHSYSPTEQRQAGTQANNAKCNQFSSRCVQNFIFILLNNPSHGSMNEQTNKHKTQGYSFYGCNMILLHWQTAMWSSSGWTLACMERQTDLRFIALDQRHHLLYHQYVDWTVWCVTCLSSVMMRPAPVHRRIRDSLAKLIRMTLTCSKFTGSHRRFPGGFYPQIFIRNRAHSSSIRHPKCLCSGLLEAGWLTCTPNTHFCKKLS